MNKTLVTILILLLIGILFRLALTENGNFLFNMDNARDFVDVREMVELHKIRLTGPNSAIEGLFNGPGWYYLLSIPYILTHGDPYGAILMQIIFWAIGGFFLLKLVDDLGRFLIIPVGLVWVASNYIVLANLYSFNPNPVVLLTPLFIYFLVKYIKNSSPFSIILSWFLAGLFFNFEMNIGIFTPLIIIISLLLTKKPKFFKSIYFWIGIIIFITSLLPQLLFDLKHQFIMSKAVLRFLSENHGSRFSLLQRVTIVWTSFYNVFQATLMNQKLLAISVLILAIPAFKKYLNTKNTTVIVSLVFILVPFLGYLLLPVTVNPWHLGAEVAASLILIGFILKSLWQINFFGKILSLFLSSGLIFYSMLNLSNFFLHDRGQPNGDPSLFKNEIAAIDYVYKYARGQNFKAYAYLPSVYDYPYQYLFWWYGQKKYGYVPGEYRYSPNKPPYIPSQDKFEGRKDNLSNLVFLIKEPDRNYTRPGWEGSFINLEVIGKEMVGPIEVEVRQEVKK